MKQMRFPGLQGLLILAFAVGCTDSVGPERRAHPRPDFATAGSGIALDQLNGTFGEHGTVLVKGFNPTNPHVGDAIVATFFWIDPTTTHTNIITSVTDRLTNIAQTPVGNTYTLVEFVSDGYISMATYVATNVQNFPDAYADPSGDQTLAVQANLALPVVDGGLLLSAWTGVNGVSAQALGAHRSATGLGVGTTVAGPGALSVNAGALVYGVTMSNGVVYLTGPAGFTSLITQSDLFMKGDGEYDAEFVVQNTAGSIDPKWTWYFTLPSTWLASGLTLNPASPPPGNLSVTTTTTGSNLDADGYTVTVDGTASQAVAANGSVSFTGLAAGSHQVALSGVATNCAVSGPASVTVTVPSGGTVTAAFTVTCAGPAGDKMTGGGKLGAGRDFATFGFEVQAAGGEIEWVQHCLDGVNPASSGCAQGGFTFHGTAAPGSYTPVSGQATCRTWSGTGTVKDKDVPSASGTYAFTVDGACDNGEPGRGRDYVAITIAGYHNSGYLSGGNIQLKGKSK